LERALGELGPDLPLQIRTIDKIVAPRELAAAPGFFDHERAVEYLNSVRAELILWGGVQNSGGTPIVHLYESTPVEGAQFGGTYNPRDFKLPDLDEMAPVVALIVATRIAGERWWLNRTGTATALRSAIAPVAWLVSTNFQQFPVSRDTVARVNFILAVALQIQGDLAWDDRPVRDAVSNYLVAFDAWNTPNFALERSMTLRWLASDFGLFGLMYRDPKTQEGAVRLLREAIAEYPKVPESGDVAITQETIGDTLEALSDGSDRRQLSEAIDAYEAALKAFRKDNQPAKWALLQRNIALTQLRLASQQVGTRNLQDTLRRLDEVLSVCKRDSMPYEWAMTEEVRGEVLLVWGDRQLGSQGDQQAISAEKAALEVLTQQAAPVVWGQAQMVLGSALSRIAQAEGAPERLEEAISALRASSIKELRERAPVAWIEAQDTLAVSLQTLGEIEWEEAARGGSWRRLDRRAHQHFEESIATARMGLQEADEERFPILWADLESVLGASLEQIGQLEAAEGESTSSYHLTEAVTAERAALRVQTIERSPDNWADSQIYLGEALGAGRA
jgi:tetratricopeptide (TPR) repeat protein